MKKIIGINGSPRKEWNTATLVKSALECAAKQGASTELVHLYDLDYKGCVSCFACKLLGGRSYGRCAVSDALKPLLEKLEDAHALVIGSPIYYGSVSGETRCFLERLLFPSLKYDANFSSIRKNPLPAGIIYTMNVPQAAAEERKYPLVLGALEASIKRTLRSPKLLSLYATDTCQFDDYARYGATAYDPAHKAKRRAEGLAEDCRKAFEMGAVLSAAEPN